MKPLKLLLTLCLAIATPAAFATDLSITAANFRIEAISTQYRTVQYGETVTAGQPVFKDAADGKYYKADNDVDQATATVVGIAYTGGAADEFGSIVVSGPVDLGATLTAGQSYVLSSTAGGICPHSDLGSSDWIVTLGVATDSDSFIVDINNTAQQVP